MNCTYIPTQNVEDWQVGLSDGAKQWKENFSAMLTAQSWHNADGFPTPIQNVFSAAGEPFAGLKLLIVLPEHQVALPPKGARPSQNDVWVLASHRFSLASIAVEGKKDESFGPTLGDWKSESDGKIERLQFLTQLLQLDEDTIDDAIRYQFLHRAASALLEAQRFHANMALCLIQSFGTSPSSWDDYCNLAKLFGHNPQRNQIVLMNDFDNIPLYLAWIDCSTTSIEYSM